MYHRRSTFNNFVYKFSPFHITIAIIFLISTIYFLYSKHKINKYKLSSKTELFAQLIYEYSLKIQKINDKSASILIQTFEYNDNLFSVESTRPDGTRVENYKWNLNSEAFMDAILKMQELVVLSSLKKSLYYKDNTIWNMAMFFIATISRKIPIPPKNHKMPWGNNWYQFSITYPRFLVIAAFVYKRLFNKINNVLQQYLTNYINKYFIPDSSGILSMGWKREGPNVIMMSIPYIGGKILMQTYNENDATIKYVLKYISLNNVTKGEGLYQDGGFIFHTNLRAYGYIYSSFEDFSLLSKFFSKPIDRLKNVFDILEHPTIKRHFSPFFTRSPSCYSSIKGKFGFFVIDSLKIVSVKTKNWYFSFNGQDDKLCYYESDKTNFSWAPLWVTARVFFYESSDSKWHFKLLTYYPGVVSYANEKPELRSLTETTTTFLPKNSKSMICKIDNSIGIRNYYFIPHNSYNLKITELMLITSNGFHSHYSIEPSQDKHDEKPIVMSLNLGKLKEKLNSGRGFGKCYRFEKNSTFFYENSGDVMNEIAINHPETDEKMICIQVKPICNLNEDNNYQATVAYSTLHADENNDENIVINEIQTIPTSSVIRTTNHVLHYDSMYPDYLFLYDSIKGKCAITAFSKHFETSISIPVSILLKKFGKSSINKLVVYNEKVIGSTEQGNQIILEHIDLPQDLHLT